MNVENLGLRIEGSELRVKQLRHDEAWYLAFPLLLGRALLNETKFESEDVSKQKWNLC